MGFLTVEYGVCRSGSHSAKLIQKLKIWGKFNPEQQINASKPLNTINGTDPPSKTEHFTQKSRKK